MLNRKPLKLDGNIPKIDDSIYMIRSPLGLPLKYTDDASVIKYTNSSVFLTNFDGFNNNSGSPVFSSAGEVSGIFTGGQENFSKDSRNKCVDNKKYFKSSGGERVMILNLIFKQLIDLIEKD